jgi:serine/threonine-protein kinase
MGTPGFMSTEQARGRTEQIDARTDLWAVGATMFRMITGRPVHEAVTLNEQLIFAATIPAPSIGDLAPWLPAPLTALIDRALAFDKNDRWPSAAAMLEALQLGLKDDSGAPAMSVSLPPLQAAALHEGAPSGRLHYQGGTLPLSDTPPFDLADGSQPPPEAAPEPSRPLSLPPVSAVTQSSAPGLQASAGPPSLRSATPTSSIPPTGELPPLAQPEAPAHRRRAVFVAIAAVASAATLGLVLLSRAPQATQDAEATSRPRPSATQHEASSPGADPPPTAKTAALADPPATQAPTAASASAPPVAEGGPGKDPRAPAAQGKEPREPTKKPATAAATATGPGKVPLPATTAAATTPPTAAPPTAAPPTAAPPTAKPGANPFDRRF